jgi:hypothetical protein
MEDTVIQPVSLMKNKNGKMGVETGEKYLGTSSLFSIFNATKRPARA